jgi:hypothetical protein
MNNRNQYDDIKGMLNKIRTLNESKIENPKKVITEDLESGDDPQEPVTNDENPNAEKQQYDNVEVVNDVEVKLLSTDQEETKLKEEEKNGISQLVDSFRQQVSQLADLDPGFTISEQQIRLDGNMTDETEIGFVFIAGEESGLYVNGDMLSIDEKTIEMLGKLLKFQPTFVTAMEPLIRDRRTS